MVTLTLTDKEFHLIHTLICAAADQSAGPAPSKDLLISYRASTPDMIDFMKLKRIMCEVASAARNRGACGRHDGFYRFNGVEWVFSQ